MAFLVRPMRRRMYYCASGAPRPKVLTRKTRHWLSNLDAHHRLLISFTFAFLVFLFVRKGLPLAHTTHRDMGRLCILFSHPDVDANPHGRAARCCAANQAATDQPQTHLRFRRGGCLREPRLCRLPAQHVERNDRPPACYPHRPRVRHGRDVVARAPHRLRLALCPAFLRRGEGR